MKRTMQNEKRALGKGLSALISDNPVSALEAQIANSGNNQMVLDIPLSELEANPWQPRKHFSPDELTDLRESIIEHGVLQPIIVRRLKDSYQIIAGERRWQASQLAGKQTIPAIAIDLDDSKMLEIALIENIQRQDLSAIEEAQAYQQLANECGYTQEQISKKVGKSRSHVANTLRLLTLPDDVQDRVSSGELSAGHARTLIGKDDASETASKMAKEGMTVRTAERIARSNAEFGKNPKSDVWSGNTDSDLIGMEESLSEHLGMRVRVRDSHNGGIMTIEFMTLEQLDALIQRLTAPNLPI